MEAYSKFGSGVAAYEIGEDYIKIQFEHRGVYNYTYATAGHAAVEHMKTLARNNDGLNTYINKHNPRFSRV